VPSKHRQMYGNGPMQGTKKATKTKGSGMYHASILARQSMAGTRPDTNIFADYVPVVIVGNLYPSMHIRCRCTWGATERHLRENGPLQLRWRFKDCPVKSKNGHG
jgi:hypothetical protein